MAATSREPQLLDLLQAWIKYRSEYTTWLGRAGITGIMEQFAGTTRLMGSENFLSVLDHIEALPEELGLNERISSHRRQMEEQSTHTALASYTRAFLAKLRAVADQTAANFVNNGPVDWPSQLEVRSTSRAASVLSQLIELTLLTHVADHFCASLSMDLALSGDCGKSYAELGAEAAQHWCDQQVW